MRTDALSLMVLAALGLAGYAAYKSYKNTEKLTETSNKLTEISDRINKTVDDISKGIEVSVDEPIIKEAVEKAVDREVKNQVKDACSDAVGKVSSDIYKEVKKAVDKKAESIEFDTEAEIKKQIGEIDITKTKNKVIKEASEKAAEKFDGELNDILGSYKGTLSNVSKIYQSISDAVAKPALESSSSKNKGSVILSL